MITLSRPTLVLHENGHDSIQISVTQDGELEIYQYGGDFVYLNWQQLQELFNYAVEKWGDEEGEE